MNTGKKQTLLLEDTERLSVNRGVTTADGIIVDTSDSVARMMGYRSRYSAISTMLDFAILSRDPSYQGHLDWLADQISKGAFRSKAGTRWFYTNLGWRYLKWEINAWIEGHLHFTFADKTELVSYHHWVRAINQQNGGFIDLAPYVEGKLSAKNLRTLRMDSIGMSNDEIATRENVTSKAIEGRLATIYGKWADLEVPGCDHPRQKMIEVGLIKFAQENPYWLELQPQQVKPEEASPL